MEEVFNELVEECEQRPGNGIYDIEHTIIPDEKEYLRIWHNGRCLEIGYRYLSLDDIEKDFKTWFCFDYTSGEAKFIDLRTFLHYINK